MTTTAAENVIVDEAKTAFEAFIASVKEAIEAFLAKITAIVQGIFGIEAL